MPISFQNMLHHPGFLKYFKNISWLFVEKLFRLGLGLLVGIWVARYLGPSQFGLFNYVISFVSLFAAFAAFGLDGIVIRELVRDASKIDKLLGTAFGIKILGAMAVLGMLFVAVDFTSNDRFTNILVFIVAGSIFFQSFNVIDAYFQSVVLSRYVVFANMISSLIVAFLKIVLIMTNASLVAFVWVVLLESILFVLGFIYFYSKTKGSIFTWRFDKDSALILLKDSWPIMLSGFVISIHMKIDQVMIKELLGSESVGQYAAAVRLSEVWYFVPLIISSSVYPAIINAQILSTELYYQRLQRLYDMLIWTALIIALPMTFIAPWVIEVLYGNAYHQAGNILMLHIWSGVFVFFGTARHKWVLSQNLQRYEIFLDVISAFLNIILNIILIPRYGVVGAVYATLLSYFLGSIGLSIFIKEFHISLIMFFKTFLLPVRLIRGKY